MKRPLYLAIMASLSLALAACGSPSEETSSKPATAPAEVETTTEAPTETEAPAERTDFIVFIEEPEPLSVFAYDNFVCSTHSEMADVLERVPAPTVQLLDADGDPLATQELQGTGPTLDDVCTMHLKILDIPVSESYRVIFSGEDDDGTPYQFEGVTDFDRGKFDEGYTQSYTFELD